MSLHRKLAEVMREADRIPKNGTAHPSMGGYKFVQVGDAADAIRRMLGERGVSMLPTTVEVLGESEHETRNGGTMTTQTLRTTWTLTDGETGEQAVIQSLGTGADTGDKFSPKAQTNAMKYALLMGFLLSTGDDPEGAETGERQGKRAVAAERREAANQDGLIGVAQTGKGDADFELRQTPQGYALIFRLVDGRKGIKVIARGELAEQIAANRAKVEGQRITAWGRVETQEFTPKDTGRKVEYQILHATRLTAPDVTLPASQPVQEAPSAPVEDDADLTGGIEVFDASWGGPLDEPR
jgi:hypothetical protein